MATQRRITRLTLRNFKNIKEQVYDFGQFDLLVGRNNSGKSTVLQALAIWQFCVDLFSQSNREGSKGIQVVLPNFTALPLPEFNLLWKEKTDRSYPIVNNKRTQQFILIQILVEWQDETGEQNRAFGIDLRYHSPQSIYAIPSGGWKQFHECESSGMPKIAYIPPFSGLEPVEKRLDIAPIRQQVGKGQPGSVLRNLLLMVSDEADWPELANRIKAWLSVDIHKPKYDSSRDVSIQVEYKQNNKNYDIISGGSGFHQTLTLLAFLYGYKPTTLLIDEPDAHLHASLQREVLDFFRRKSSERGMQMLIATHAEEFIKGVETSQIISLLNQHPTRIQSTPKILRALAEVANEEIHWLTQYPFILYVEGADDERILRAWADPCGASESLGKVYIKTLGGGSKKEMVAAADVHFEALRQIIPHASRLVLLDYDSDNTYHPDPSSPVHVEWKRKNIEGYLLVPEAWKRAVGNKKTNALRETTLLSEIDEFFTEQNLTLPPNKTWHNVTANIFKMVDGKRILFEDDESLFHKLGNIDPSAPPSRPDIALCMLANEIHQDVHLFFKKLSTMVHPQHNLLKP
ncbi:MAG: AAA family ATPase [Magnetococcales bacterium]|nr:AAA family ATPase [Magnetococcales bacterium]NGZ26571.1 AAA family ATPase [Magnetococcales bacterium]